MLTGRQLRDARFRAGLELRELAAQAGLDHLQLAYAEAVYDSPPWSEEEFARVRRTLEAAGVEVVPESGDAQGVRLKKAAP